MRRPGCTHDDVHEGSELSDRRTDTRLGLDTIRKNGGGGGGDEPMDANPNFDRRIDHKFG